MPAEVVIFPGPIEVGPKQPRKAAPKDKSFLNAGAGVQLGPKSRPDPSDAPGGFDDQVLQGAGNGKSNDDLRDALDDEKDDGDDGNAKDNDARDGDAGDNDAREKDDDPKGDDARDDDFKDDDAKDDDVKDES